MAGAGRWRKLTIFATTACAHAWLLSIGVGQDAVAPACVDTCNSGSQRAKNGVCEERGLTDAPCEISHTCLCTPHSDESDCRHLRPCTVPREVLTHPALPPPPISSETLVTSTVGTAPQSAISSARGKSAREHQELEFVLAVSLLMLLVTLCRSTQKARKRRAARDLDPSVLSSQSPLVALMCIQVVRAKGFSLGRMFKASVRVTVISDRVAHVERKQTAVRDSTYSPGGFSVEWYEDLHISILSDDCLLSVEIVEHVIGHPGATTEEERVIAAVRPWRVMHEPAVAGTDWHALNPVRADDEERVAGSMLKLKLEQHAAQVTDDGASIVQTKLRPNASATFSSSSAEELAEALMQSTHRESAIRACLQHVQKIMMGAMTAAPMAERKLVYKQATQQLAALAAQPLCSASLWDSDEGRAATSAVGSLMHQVFGVPTDTDRQVDVQRAARFVKTVELGPEYSKMYQILVQREDSDPNMSTSRSSESQSNGPSEASTANPLSASAAENDTIDV